MRRNTKDIQCDKTENALEDILDIEINEKSKVQDELSFDDIDKIIEEELAHYNLTVLSANVTNAKKIESTQEDMDSLISKHDGKKNCQLQNLHKTQVHQETGILDSTQKCQGNQDKSKEGILKTYSDKPEDNLKDNVDIDISENDIDKMIEEELSYYNLTDRSTKNIYRSIDCKTKELILSPKTLTFK